MTIITKDFLSLPSWPHLMTSNSHVWAYWSRAAEQSTELGLDIVTKILALTHPSTPSTKHVTMSARTATYLLADNRDISLHVWYVMTRFSRVNVHIVTLSHNHMEIITRKFLPCQHRRAYLSIKTSLPTCLCMSGLSWQISLATPRISLPHFVTVLQNLNAVVKAEIS